MVLCHLLFWQLFFYMRVGPFTQLFLLVLLLLLSRFHRPSSASWMYIHRGTFLLVSFLMQILYAINIRFSILVTTVVSRTLCCIEIAEAFYWSFLASPLPFKLIKSMLSTTNFLLFLLFCFLSYLLSGPQAEVNSPRFQLPEIPMSEFSDWLQSSTCWISPSSSPTHWDSPPVSPFSLQFEAVEFLLK